MIIFFLQQMPVEHRLSLCLQFNFISHYIKYGRINLTMSTFGCDNYE